MRRSYDCSAITQQVCAGDHAHGLSALCDDQSMDMPLHHNPSRLCHGGGGCHMVNDRCHHVAHGHCASLDLALPEILQRQFIAQVSVELVMP